MILCDYFLIYFSESLAVAREGAGSGFSHFLCAMYMSASIITPSL